MNEKEFLKNGTIEKPETKEDLQIKKLKLQNEILEEKKRQLHQKSESKNVYIQKNNNNIFKILLLLISPVFIIGGFLIACANATTRTSRRRRF